MRTVSALELRAKVGQYLDAAAKGERIIVERSGQRLCALVPLEDVERWDPDRRKARRLAALQDIREFARLHPAPPGDTAEMIRRMREERTEQILGSSREWRDQPSGSAQEEGS